MNGHQACDHGANIAQIASATTELVERGAIDLAARGQRNRVEEHDRPRNLVRREPRGAEPAHVERVDAVPPVGDDAGDDLLAAPRVGRRDDTRRRATPGMSPQHLLDFVRLHFPAGDVDERRDAPAQRQPLPVVQRAVVAGQKAAVAEAVRVAVGVARRRRPRSARGRVRLRMASLVRPQRDRRRPATGGRRRRSSSIVVAVVEGDAAGFRRAVEGMNLHAEALVERADRRRQRAARPPRSAAAGRAASRRRAGWPGSTRT